MITIPIDTQSKQAIYIQIYEYIKAEILCGNLSASTKLPSTRSLAANLQVSRSTVDTAYDQLVAEGYVEPKEKRGYFVTTITHIQQFNSGLTPARQHICPDSQREIVRFDFNPDTIDTEHFPYSVWKSIGKNQLDNPINFLSGDHFGEFSLRQAISDYLRGSRGVTCAPDSIIIGAGLDHLLQMLCVLFARRSIVAMEDPGYQSARQVLISNGYAIIDVPLRDKVIDLDILARSSADLCYVTPSHQFPLGSVMPISRRQELLAWANKAPNRYIIEDDHDSEFRYKGKPIPALQSLDNTGRVIYIGSFSKAITPSIRTGYMVLPEELMEEYKQKCGAYACPVSRLNQAMLTDFIQEGYFEKHLNRMRKIYKTKHDWIVEQIHKYFPGNQLEISGDHAGLYILIHYKGSLSEEEINQKAKENHIQLHSLRDYYAKLPVDYQPTYLLGFANLSTEKIEEGIHCLAEKVFV